MALTLDDRFPIPVAWTDIEDAFPGPDAWAGWFDAINDLAAQDSQGARGTRPAAGAGTSGGARGGYYWATDGTAGGSARDLARSDGAAWWSIALLASRADFVAGVTVAADATTQQTSAYAPFGVTRSAAAGAAFIALNRNGHANRPGIGVDAADDSLLLGLATNTSDLTALAALKTNGELDVVGADHRFGANARGAAGTQVHLGSRGDAANAYVGAEGSPSTIGLIIRAQGAAGTIYLQPDASTTAATFTATAVTLAKATTISAGGLTVAGGATVTGDVWATAGALKTTGSGGTPRLYMKATDAGVNEKVWDVAPIGTALWFRLLNDAETSSNPWASVVRSGTNVVQIGLYGFTSVAGGLAVAGSPTGYSDEIKFASTDSGASAALTCFGTGTPGMYFDHRGAAGNWLWRNGVGAANTQASLSTTGDFTPSGHVQIGRGLAIRDSTTTGKLLYHDASNVYIGAIDGGDSRGLILRSNGNDVAKVDVAGYLYAAIAPGTTHESVRLAGTAQMSARGFAINADGAAFQGGSTVGVSIAISRNAPALTVNNGGGPLAAMYVGSTPKLSVDSVGQLASAGVTTHLGAGAIGASGGVLSIYADNGASEVWQYARAQDLATYRNLNLRALGTRFWDAAGNLQAAVGQESDLFSLDTSLFARWRDGSGTTSPLAQVRLTTGFAIRTGLADSLFVLRMG
jgi:hypothetical protein